MPDKNRGAISELLVAADLLDKGFDVFRALSQHASCDLIALDADGSVSRIEVRTANRRRGIESNGQVIPNCRPTDKCDLYAFVTDGDVIEYVTPEEAVEMRDPRRSRLRPVAGVMTVN